MYHSGSALVATTVSGLDGKAVWMAPHGAAASHRNTDESIPR